MTLQLMLSKPFPIDVLLLLAVAFLSGFAWTVGAWVSGRILR